MGQVCCRALPIEGHPVDEKILTWLLPLPQLVVRSTRDSQLKLQLQGCRLPLPEAIAFVVLPLPATLW